MAERRLAWLLACNLVLGDVGNIAEQSCGAQWWRRIADGQLLHQPPGASCPRQGGGSRWVEVMAPLGDAGAAEVFLTVELERDGVPLFELASTDELSKRFATAGSQTCGGGRVAHQSLDCAAARPGRELTARSEQVGQKACAHPEAKEARALFCRYPPRFYGHQGICQQYSQFCRFSELEAETDSNRLDTAVVNVDYALFHALEHCGSLTEELWIFKVFVHWCPHCQQLMPKLYRLALVLQQKEAVRLRFGAINCATEHELCAEQKWGGHPLLVVRYLGPDDGVHRAIENWVDVVKDAQLRQMLPRYALPGEYPLLELLFKELPEDFLPSAAWKPLFDKADSSMAGACPNVTEMHPKNASCVDDGVGNGWSDFEADFTPKRRLADALLMLRHALQEYILPIGDDGNVEAFSYAQVHASEAFVGLLCQNLPPAAASLRPTLSSLRSGLRASLRSAQAGRGGALCATAWKELLAPTVTAIEELGKETFSEVASACGSDTCRMWTLLHMLSLEGLRCHGAHAGSDCAPGGPLQPPAFLAAIRAFMDQYFKCATCRRHFLQRFDEGLFGQAEARKDPAELVLYLWRLHNAVSVRLMAENGCDEIDRRWPSLSLCASCWDVGATEAWEVLYEASALAAAEGKPPGRALRLPARPVDSEVLRFLTSAFVGNASDMETPTAAPAIAT